MSDLHGKVVLVTGAGGFIGSHLAERLVEEGAQVRAFVHYNSNGSCGWLDGSDLWSHIHFFHGDLRDPGMVEEAVSGANLVMHLGALIGIPYSYVAPESYVQTNINGTLNVLKASRRFNVERLLVTSTSEVYGTARYAPIDEQHPLQGQSPYSATKIGADKLAEAFHLSFEQDVVVVRPFNTFGPRQSTRAVIPTIIGQILARKRVIHLGSLRPKRDLNYVSNTVDAFLAASIAPGIEGRTIHFGSGREVAIGELVEVICNVMNADVEVETEDRRLRPAGSEVGRLLADNSLARELLGWSPRVSLEEGLGKVVDWMEQNPALWKENEYIV